MADGIAMV